MAASGWFAAQPSGTEHIDNIYAGSFQDEKYLEAIVAEVQQIVANSLTASWLGLGRAGQGTNTLIRRYGTWKEAL